MAIGFSLLSNANPATNKVVRTSGSQAYTIGDLVMLDRTSDAVDVVPATASSTTVNVYGVAQETVISTVTALLITIVDSTQEWTADVTNNSNTNHNYQRMILTDKATVNNTGTDDTTLNAVFMQTGAIGTAASKRIVGKFLKVANITA